jgi:uncharacterized protein
MQSKTQYYLNILGFFIAYLVVLSIIQLIIFLLLGIEINDLRIENISLVNNIYIALPNTLLVYGAFYLIKKEFKLPISIIKLTSSFAKKSIVAFFNSFILISGTLSIAFLGNMSTAFFAVNPNFNLVNLALSFLFFVLVAINEEVFFRGIILPYLLRRNSIITSVSISSLFFAILHLPNPNMTTLSFVNIFIAGILLGLIFVVTNFNVFYPIIIHLGWNFFQGSIFGFEVSGQQTLSLLLPMGFNNPLIDGGKFGLEGGLCDTIVESLAIIIVVIKNYQLIFAKPISVNDELNILDN